MRRQVIRIAAVFVALVALAAPAWAAYEFYITGINGDGTVSGQANGRAIILQVPDPGARSRLQVGQKIMVDEATGKASLQDFHFTVKVNTASPKLFTGGVTPPPTQPKQVTINGKMLTTSARVVNGKVYVPLEDFSRAVGGNGITLDSSLKLEFPNLVVVGGKSDPAVKIDQKVAPSPAVKLNPAATIKMNPGATIKLGDGSVRSFQVLSLNRAGVISSHLLKLDGKVFVPLADILIGLNQDPSRINANSMSLNFTVPAVQNSIIGVL